MQYWDTDDPNRNAIQKSTSRMPGTPRPKVVVSTTLTEVGPNATLISK